MLHQKVQWIAKSLEQFEQDTNAYAGGNKAVLNAHGRSWRFLANPESRKAYDAYLSKRAATGRKTDQRFYELFQATPGDLDKVLDNALDAAEAEAPEGSDKEGHSIFVAEEVVAGWAAVTLRQNRSDMQWVIDKHSRRAKHVLEPYVLDGLPLLAQGRARLALSLLAHDGFYDKDDRVSVYTAFFGSEEDDRIETGKAISDYLRKVYGQAHSNTDGQRSLGYPHGAPELGVILAFRRLIDLAKTDYPRGMLMQFADRFFGAVKGLNDGRKRPIALPRDVEKVISHPESLEAKLNKVRARSWQKDD